MRASEPAGEILNAVKDLGRNGPELWHGGPGGI
jgi:hypothetical protein